MSDPSTALSARQFFEDAYADEREPAHAERWLGLLAVQAADGKPLTWLHSAEMVRRRATLARQLASAALIAAMFIPGFVVVLLSDRAHLILSGLALITMWAAWSFSVRSRQWSAAGPYRTARRDCLRRGLAWAPAGAVVGLISAPAGMGVWVLFPVAGYSTGIAALAAARTGAYPLALCAEVILAAGWGERPAFAALLEDAADREILRAAGDGYEFRDGLRCYLAGRGEAALAEHSATLTARLASPRARWVPAARLTRRGAARAGWDTAAGAAIAAALVTAAILRFYGNLSSYGWAVVFPAAGMALVAGGGAYLGLRAAAALARLAVAYVPGWEPAIRLELAAPVIACGAGLVITEGPSLTAIVAYCLPAVLVAGCGGWACWLARRRWARLIPDLIAVATVAVCLLVLVRRTLLTAEPAAGLLFPVAVWGTIRLWRAMAGSRRLMVSAAANIAASLLFGGELVLLLVWLANVLRFSAPVVAALRWCLEQAGSRADLPWWAWTGLYAVLAGAGVAAVRWPGLLSRDPARRAWRRIVPAAGLGQQVLSGLHIGLLAIVLVGLAAPASVGPVIRRQVSAAYQVALQREFDDSAEVSAYQAIARQFTSGPPHSALTALVTKVHDVAGPGGEQPDATSSEEDLARRLGELQARVLALPPVSSVPAASVPAAERQAAAGNTGVAGQTSALADLDKADEASDERVEQASELAAKLVASTLNIASISDNEVFQVVREYLAGLVEESRLTDVFAAWARHLPGARRPATADALLTPDPVRLEAAADATIRQTMVAQGLGDPATDPNAPSIAYQLALDEKPLEATVDLTNQERYLQSPSSGPCDGCAAPEIPVPAVRDAATWIEDFGSQTTEERPGEEEPEEPAVHEP